MPVSRLSTPIRSAASTPRATPSTPPGTHPRPPPAGGTAEGWGMAAAGWIYRESSTDPTFDPATLAGNGSTIPPATAVATFAPAGDCGGPAGFGNCYGYSVNAVANLPGRPAIVDQPFGAGHAIMLGFDPW